MNRILFLLLLLFSILAIGAVNKFDVHPVKQFEANPINVAVMLTERPDSASLASICEYYGYVLQTPQDGYTVYKHPKGFIIRYSFQEANNGKEYSTVEVISKASQKEKDKILHDLHFQKIGDDLGRQSVGYTIRCTHGTKGSLIFQQQPKPKK